MNYWEKQKYLEVFEKFAKIFDMLSIVYKGVASTLVMRYFIADCSHLIGLNISTGHRTMFGKISR